MPEQLLSQSGDVVSEYFFVLLEIARARAAAGVTVGWHEDGAASPDVKLDYFSHQDVQPREQHILTEGQELQLGNIILLVKLLDEGEINGKEIRSILMKIWSGDDLPLPTAAEIDRPVRLIGVGEYPAWVVDRARHLLDRHGQHDKATDWVRAIAVVLMAVNAQRYSTEAGPDDPVLAVVPIG